ncbi:hypothetical protein [Bacillus cereus]|uniref:hypothetical protein n=1 Tax=Bacillus cereus TaxID=1396 RepID=UPI00101410C5|nr:hypothetical protein [Bacillus cereus]GCF83388.1 hypothetical protein BCACH14_53640 [Bacillus cereus]HDR8164450.1 hypothetical protein [Bacillus cereus]
MDPNIIVAIISGIVTVIVGIISAVAAYYGAIKGSQLQIEKAQNDAAEAKKEEERLSRRFIETFLYSEISGNLEIISTGVIQAFKNKSDETLVGGYIISEYDFKEDTYNEIKPQLNKINDLVFVADVMSIYQCFRKINRIKRIHEVKSEEALEIYNSLNKWSNKLNVEHLN